MAIRYGWNLYDWLYDDQECNDCGRELDIWGNHSINCGSKDGVFTITHNKIRDVLCDNGQRADMNFEKEKAGLLDSGGKPADIYGHGYKNGTDYAFDVTVKSPYIDANIAKTIKSVGITTIIASLDKYKKYKTDIINVPFIFQPLAFERTGGWGLPSQLFVKHIAKQLASKFNINFNIMLQSMVREISCILLKQAAKQALRRKVDNGPMWAQ